jgi:hypothetical protein
MGPQGQFRHGHALFKRPSKAAPSRRPLDKEYGVRVNVPQGFEFGDRQFAGSLAFVRIFQECYRL